jgi:hypothetical protein
LCVAPWQTRIIVRFTVNPVDSAPKLRRKELSQAAPTPFQVIVFVNTVDTGFRVKLFLENFGLRSVMLNAELPANRCDPPLCHLTSIPLFYGSENRHQAEPRRQQDWILKCLQGARDHALATRCCSLSLGPVDVVKHLSQGFPRDQLPRPATHTALGCVWGRSRAHILQQFNAGLFDFLIATDDVHPSAPSGRGGKRDRQKDVEFGVVSLPPSLHSLHLCYSQLNCGCCVKAAALRPGPTLLWHARVHGA